jgi:hypothetical protein
MKALARYFKVELDQANAELAKLRADEPSAGQGLSAVTVHTP